MRTSRYYSRYPNRQAIPLPLVECSIQFVRENEEGLYAGIEYQLSIDVMECLKLIPRPGTEKIVRFAFEYAKFTKDNIMQMTDDLFSQDLRRPSGQ